MNANPAIIPTFLLWVGFFAAGEFLYKRGPRLTFAIGLLLAIPCGLAALYYVHLFDNALWYYELRAPRWTDLAFSGIGFLAGAIQRWNSAETRVGRFAVPTVFAVLFLIPFIKPILQPLDMGKLQDRCSGTICLQSSYATCGPASAATILRGFGETVTEKDLALESYTYSGGTEAWYLARAVRRRGFNAEFRFTKTAFPAPSIAGVRVGGGHFIAILSASDKAVTVVDPLSGEFMFSPEELRAKYRFTGFFLTVQPPAR